MGDGIKLSKEKRHRSSSSLAGHLIEETRSDRKIDLTDSIAEIDDQFALAEAKCENLQNKIDLVKVVKRRKKLKKLSTTRVNDQHTSIPPENMSFITVRTQPKKKVAQARSRLVDQPKSVRGYVDPAHEEQRRMLGQVRGYNRSYEDPHHQEFKVLSEETSSNREANFPSTRARRLRVGGDRVMFGRSVQIDGPDIRSVVKRKDSDEYANYEDYSQSANDYFESPIKKSADVRQPISKPPPARRRHVPKDYPVKRGDTPGERRIVELYNNDLKKNVVPLPITSRQPNEQKWNIKKDVREPPPHESLPTREKFNDQSSGPIGDGSSTQPDQRHLVKTKYRCRRYELPTMASQMKHTGVRYYQGASKYPNIPFIVSKSTAPSHNIGVNIQQVLNGLKVQQPLTGIPPTIAYHMGLRHQNSFTVAKNNLAPTLLEQNDMNTIKLGRRLVRLPSRKYISYNRVLNLYREGDGIVPRFLRSINRPHYFYTSMYNLATHQEDQDGATSKGHGAAQEVKQGLAEYASLYREYEQLDKALREGNYEPEWQRRCDEISRELMAREKDVRKMVQDYKGSDVELAPLRASASIAEDSCRRRSSFKLGD